MNSYYNISKSLSHGSVKRLVTDILSGYTMAYYCGLPLQLVIVLLGVFRSSMIVCGQDFTLEMRKLLPCQVTSKNSTVSLYQSDVLAIQADLNLCPSSWIKNNYNVSHMHCMESAYRVLGNRLGEYCRMMKLRNS